MDWRRDQLSCYSGYVNGPNVELYKSLTIAAFPATALVAMTMGSRISVSQVHRTPSIGRVHHQSQRALPITNHTAEHRIHDVPTENRCLSTCPLVSDSDAQVARGLETRTCTMVTPQTELLRNLRWVVGAPASGKNTLGAVPAANNRLPVGGRLACVGFISPARNKKSR